MKTQMALPAQLQDTAEDIDIGDSAITVVITSDEGLEAQFGPVQQEAPILYSRVDITEP